MVSLRVDIVSSHPPSEQGLGMPHVVSRLSRFLVDWGHRVRVYYPTRGTKGVTRDVWDGVESWGVPSDGLSWAPFGSDLAFSRRVAKLLDPNVDVVMANNERGGAPVIGRARVLARKNSGHHPLAVEVIHGLNLRVLQLERAYRPRRLRARLGYYADYVMLRHLEGEAARRADVCVVPSKMVRKDMIETYGVDNARAEVIYNGVEPQPLRTAEDQRQAQAALGLPSGTRYLSFLGHDTTRKGLDIALATVQALRRQGLAVMLLNMGNDVPSTDGMRSFGVVDEATKRRGLLASDVFYLPTHYDTLPLAVLEAASMGVPVVTTPGANVELGSPGRDFVLVTDNRASGHAKVLADLLPDADRLAVLGRNGRTAIGTRSYELQAREYLALFTKYLGS